MSPANVRGRMIDRRTNVWAFGGDDATEIVATIVKSLPDWTLLLAQTPASVRSLLRRCRQKDQRRRMQHIGDARVAIAEAITQPERPATFTAAPIAPVRRSREQLAWIAATSVLAIVVAGFGVGYVRRTPVERAAVRCNVLPPE